MIPAPPLFYQIPRAARPPIFFKLLSLTPSVLRNITGNKWSWGKLFLNGCKEKNPYCKFPQLYPRKKLWEGREMQKQSQLQNFDGVRPVARKRESSAACRHRSRYLLLGYVDGRTYPLSGYVQPTGNPSKNCDRGWVSPSPVFLCLPTFFSWMWLRKLK